MNVQKLVVSFWDFPVIRIIEVSGQKEGHPFLESHTWKLASCCAWDCAY